MKAAPDRRLAVLLVVGDVLLSVGLVAGDPPAPAKLSTVAPAEDLIRQVEIYLDGFAAALADADKFDEEASKIRKEAHTLVVLALALGKHDADHRLKGSAPALFRAARDLAAAKDHAAATQALEALRAAAAGSGGEGPELEWEPVAPLGQVMKQVTLVNNRLRRGMRRFEDKAEENARDAAVLAAIAQAVAYDTHEVKNADDVGQWYQFCGEMRDAAGQLGARIKAADKQGAEAALRKLTQSCDACHKVFRPEL